MKKAFLWAVALLLFAAAPASAHVTIQPPESTTGAFARFVVRVPNEHETAATIKVEVQMPAEFEEVRYQPKEGWRRTVNGRTVTWEGGRIAPGEFDEFGFSTRMPDKAGALTFPSIQTYDNGEVVSWTGPEDADKPAGRVTVKQAEGGSGGGHGASTDTTAAAASNDDEGKGEAEGEAEGDNASSSSSGDGDDDTDALVFVALALSGLSLVIALAGVAAGRRRP